MRLRYEMSTIHHATRKLAAFQAEWHRTRTDDCWRAHETKIGGGEEKRAARGRKGGRKEGGMEESKFVVSTAASGCDPQL